MNVSRPSPETVPEIAPEIHPATYPRAALLSGAFVALLVFLFHLPFAGDALFFDDAADYVRAADPGFLPMWLNTNSASPLQLVRLRRADPAFRAHPWDALYVMNDNAALRHFHVPVSFYALQAVRAVTPSERAVRLSVSGATALTCGLLAVLLAELSVPLLLAVPLALLAGVQSRFIETSVDPSPHSWYILFAVLFLSCFSLYLVRRQNRYLYVAAGCFALAFATLEFSVELIASVPLALLAIAFTGRGRLPHWRDARLPLLRALGLFLLTTAAVWPGGWFRGGYLESYGVLGATVLFKNKSAFGEKLTPAVIYQAVFADHAALLLLTAVCAGAIVYLLLRRELPVGSIVFATYSLIAFGLGMADHFRLSTYVSEFLLFLIATSGLVLADLLRTLRLRPALQTPVLAGCALLLLTGCGSEWRLRNAEIAFRPWLRPVFEGIRAHVPPGDTLLVNTDWEALTLYLPAYHYEPTSAKTAATPRSALRNERTRYAFFEGEVTSPPPGQAIQLFTLPHNRTATLWRIER